MLSKAFEFASIYHASMLHPMAVASIVLENGGDEVQATAAVLHDTIADGQVTYLDIQSRFGSKVADLVFAFDNPEGSKSAYLKKLEAFDSYTLLVVAAEELHDGSEINSKPTKEVIAYYESLLQLFERKFGSELKALLGEFHLLVNKLRNAA